MNRTNPIPERTIERMVLYKRILTDLQSKGIVSLFSHPLAELAHNTPTDGLTGLRMWALYHKHAQKVLDGDLDAYTEVLQKANPLGELTGYAENITMRAPSADRLESCFVCKKEQLEKNRKLYLSAMGLRIARDLLACLPVEEIAVTGEDDGMVIFSATYTRQQLLHRNFVFTDPVALARECGAEFK